MLPAFWQIPTMQDVMARLQRSSSTAQSISAYAKHNSTISSEKRKSHLEPSVSLRAQFENISTLKQRRRLRPHAREPTFLRTGSSVYPKKMLRANPNNQIASMMCENEAFVRGFGQIPRVEDVKTKLSCDTSLNFQELKI